MIRKVLCLVIVTPLLTIGAAKVESQLTLTNARFSPSGKYVRLQDGSKCIPQLAIDGDAPPDHYGKEEKDSTLYSYYINNRAGPCNGAAQGKKGDSLHVEIEERASPPGALATTPTFWWSVDGVTRFEAWPGVGWKFEEPFWRFSQLLVCQNADFTKCRRCHRQTGKRCRWSYEGRCAPESYPYIPGGKAPITYRCNPRKTRGRYVKVIVPPHNGKRWGHRSARYAKFGLIEISAFGNVIPCGEGYKLVGDQCVGNQCYCDNGTGAHGSDCPNIKEAKCIACNTGFYLLADNSCKVSNQQCLQRMMKSLSNENLLVNVTWVNGYILMSRIAGRSGVHLAKFEDVTIKSYTVETGLVKFIDAHIGWIPVEKICKAYNHVGYYQRIAGSCYNIDKLGLSPFGRNKNSGIGRNARPIWYFEGKKYAIKYDGSHKWNMMRYNWRRNRWLVKTTLQRKTNDMWPTVSVEFEDGQIDTFSSFPSTYGKYLQWDNLVPGISVGSGSFRVVDAECD